MPPQFVVPETLINQYYAQKPAMIQQGSEQIGQGLNTLANYQQLQQQRRLQALEAYSKAFGAGGPYLANQVGNEMQKTYGINLGINQNQPQTSQAPSAPVTAGIDNTTSAIPETVQAHMDMGHPNYAGLGNSSNQSVYPQNNSPYDPFSIPNEQLAGMGEYGANVLKAKKEIGDIQMQPLSAQEKLQQIRKIQSEFANPEQGAAIASGDPNAISAAYSGQAPVQAYQFAANKKFEKDKAIAAASEKAGESFKTLGQINDQINQLADLFKGYNPVPFTGKAGASLAAASGSKTFGTKTMQQGQQIEQITPLLSATINYEINRRFSPAEANLIRVQVTPTAQDNEANAMTKITKLRNLVNVMQTGDIQQLQNVASAIAGQPINAHLPTAYQSPQIPNGRITVRNKQGQIGHIPQSQLKAALAEGYTQVQ